MKYVVLLLTACLAACGTGAPYKQQDLVIDKQVQAMSRTEIQIFLKD